MGKLEHLAIMPISTMLKEYVNDAKEESMNEDLLFAYDHEKANK